MPRASFPSGRKLLLLIALTAAIIIAGVWWSRRPPPEPVYRGRLLSEIVAAVQGDQDAWKLSPDQVKGYGPAGVAWLTYKLEHGLQPFIKEGPLPLDNAPEWLRQFFPEKWGGLQVSTAVDERFVAVRMLQSFGPDAAPAIPALVRSLNNSDPVMVGSAAISLHSIGPASWPMVQKILDTGSQQTRMILVNSMWVRLTLRDDEARDPTLAPAVEALVKALHDPVPGVRIAAATAVLNCNKSRKNDARCEPAIPALVELLSDHEHPGVEVTAMDALGSFGVKAASAIPRLIELLDSEEWVRRNAAEALFSIDKVEKRSEPHFRAMLQDPNRHALAVRAFNAFGLPLPEEPASEKKPQDREE